MTLTDSQWTQLLLALGGVAGYFRLRWQRNEDRKDALEDRRIARVQALEDEDRRRKEEKDEREIASQERRDATAQIIAKAEAEAKAMKILTEATADKLRIEAIRVAERLADQNKREYALSTAAIEQKIAQVHDAATSAFKEANHVNLKIGALQQVIEGQQDAAKTQVAADTGKLDKLQETADAIDGKVDTIVKDAP